MKRLLLFAVGILVFALWVHYIDLEEVWRNIRAAQLGYLGPGLLFYFISYGVKIVRWQLILAPIRRIPFWPISQYYWACEFMNTFMPFRLAELSKAGLLKKNHNVTISDSLSTIVVDRIYGIVIRIVVLCCMPLFAINLYPIMKGYLMYAASLASCTMLVLLILVFNDIKVLEILKRMLGFLPIGWVEGVVHFIQSFLGAVRKAHVRRRDILLYLLLSCFSLLAQAIRTQFFFKAVGVELPLEILIITVTIMDFLFLLPSPPGALGTTEWYINLLYTVGLGISKNTVASFALLSHGINLGLIAMLGLASLSATGQDIFRKRQR